MDWEADLKRAICEGDEIKADEIVVKALEEGADATDLLERGAVAAAKQFGRYPIPADLETLPFRPPEFLPFDEWVGKEGLPT